MRHIVIFVVVSHCVASDGNLRDVRSGASDHGVSEWHNPRVDRILRFKALASCRLSSNLRCFFLLTIWQDAISHVMHSPMSFFETTVRTIWLDAFLLRLNPVRSRLAVL
jgi:hypothetical protein